MDTWPTEPLIHIIEGECEGNYIENTLAKHEPGYSDDYPDTYDTTMTDQQKEAFQAFEAHIF